MPKKVIVIGSGFAGLSSACFMAKAGLDVTIIEHHNGPGGRARQLQTNGYTFDMGPSWYWMPDVFERFFQQFGKSVGDYYSLTRLDPSYRVYWPEGFTDLPAELGKLQDLFESIEPGSSKRLQSFLKEAAFKYQLGMQNLVFKPGLSIKEFLNTDVVKGLFKMDILTSVKAHIGRYFSHERLLQILEFPVLFLGALPEKTPALYSLMNYADIVGGTWYPQGGMYSIVNAMHQLALELGVRFHFSETATQILTNNKKAVSLRTNEAVHPCDAVIAAADYHFVETQLLQPEERSYTEKYWDSRVMAPSSLLYYVGINKRIAGLRHHSLFFDAPFGQHGREIYTNPQWPSHPLFYVSATSVTDPNVAPAGHENLFFLIPVAAGLSGDTEALRKKYFDMIFKRFQDKLGVNLSTSIDCYQSFAYSNFVSEYNSFKGNAYGLANTLMQTAILKPSCRSRKIGNLYYAGQLTVPGPGVPPSLISGEVVANEVIKNFG